MRSHMPEGGFRSVISDGNDRKFEWKPNIHRTRGGYVLGFRYILRTRMRYRIAELSSKAECFFVVDRLNPTYSAEKGFIENHSFGFH